MKQQVSITFMMTGILFISCLLISNIIASKIVMFGPFAVPAVILIFPVAYIINDVVTEVWGFRKARLIIWSGFAMNLIAAILYSLSINWTAIQFWQDQSFIETFLNSTPRALFAGLVAYLFGSFINAVIMSKLKLMTKGKSFSLRAIISTIFGEGFDSLIYIAIAFVGSVSIGKLILLVIAYSGIKILFEIILLPLTILIVKAIKKNDQTDIFDTETSYNPFKISEI